LASNVTRIESIESGAHTFTGIKTFEDDVILESNLRVNGELLVANTVHMIVSDPIMELGANNLNTGDLGIIMTRHGETGNVAIVYDESQDVLNVGYTLSNAYENTITMDTANSLTLQVNNALNVGSNVVIDDAASNVIEVSGNVKTDSLFLGNFEVVASQGLSHVTAVSAATNDTVYLNNPTTGLVVGSNVEVGGNLSVDSNVEVGGNLSVEGDVDFNGNLTMNTITVQTLFTLEHVVSQGNTTSNTVQFTNPTTALTATGNVEVGGELSVSGNVEVGTANLFVDTVTGNVGVGTTEPRYNLDVNGGKINGYPVVSASGGTETTSGNYKIHTFTTSANFTVSTPGMIEFLLVAGGGGGGSRVGGGGGGGGVMQRWVYVGTGTHAIQIGAGGSGSTSSVNPGSTGTDTTFINYTAKGGGGGESSDDLSAKGNDGGSGGGGLYAHPGGHAMYQQGHIGTLKGYGVDPGVSPASGQSRSYGANGGGGGGREGYPCFFTNIDNVNGGAGGDGFLSSISGSDTYYAGGGGGSISGLSSGSAGAGGSGGGGAGGKGSGGDGTDGTANTGGGGGGGGFTGSSNANGGSGGSGIAIIRYIIS